METIQRNANLTDLAELLKEQHVRKHDIVAPATALHMSGGLLHIAGAEPELSEEGVTSVDGIYTPTRVFDEGVADKLGIPIRYLRKMRETHTRLYDANVNGWLRGDPNYPQINPALEDGRKFFVRCFKGDDGEPGIARALLSDSYRTIDHLDVLMASLKGIDEAGVEVNIDACDLTDRRMYVRVVAPEVQVLAEELLKGYRNPFGDDFEKWRNLADREGMGYGEEGEPIVFAGFVIANSEVGGGASTITPRAVIKVCKNGLTFTWDAMRDVHLGGKLETGVVDWSAETVETASRLITQKARDAVHTFLTPRYLAEKILQLEEKSGEPVKVDAVTTIGKKLQFTETQMSGILDRFVQGGQMTLGGVTNAITAHAQTVADGDEQAKLEAAAVSLLV